MPLKRVMGYDSPARHLARLFEEYDCVILPGIGGFLLHENTSVLRKEDQQAWPPARIVKFNTLLKDDDGLLTHSIAKTRSVSFAEGKKIVDSFVNEGLRTLQNWESWELEGIGSFRLNNEEKVVFTPSKDFNCLPASFGLKAVSAKRIKRPEKARPMRARRIDRKPSIPETRTPGTVRWTVILALPVIAFLTWGIIAPESVQRHYTSYSFLFPEILKTGLSTPNVSSSKPAQTMPSESGTGKIIPDETEKIAVKPADDKKKIDPESIIPKEESIPEADKSTQVVSPYGKLAIPVTPPGEPKRYYVIGGAFQETENANRFIASLKQKGFDPEVAGANGSGHLRISYASFTRKTEALSYLGGIREKENPGAWLLRY